MRNTRTPSRRTPWTGISAANGVALIIAFALTAFVHAQRTLEHEAVIDAPVADVWRLFTTSDGARQWMAPKVEVELRVGGSIRSSYNPASTLDDEHTIVNRILSYEPERMLSMRNVQAPAGFAHKELFQETWSAIYFEPIGAMKTRVRMVGLGYGEGPEWDELYAFFRKGNQYVLDQLQQRFASAGADDSDEVLKLLHRLIGGEWIHESETPDGRVFRVRNVIEFGPDGESLAGRGWLGDAAGMIDHGRALIYRSPDSEGGEVRFINVNEHGAIARGPIRLAGPNAVEWDWAATNTSGEVERYRVQMRFPEDPDAYTFTLHAKSDDGAWTEMVEVDYTRVKEAPARFRSQRDGH